MTLSAWLRAAAHQRMAALQQTQPFESADDMEAFFRQCDALESPETEPNWDEHLAVIDESRRRGVREIGTFDQALGAVAGGHTRAK